MDGPERPEPPRQLHPLPRGLVELYGLLAVLFVLVPEWMAGSLLTGLPQGLKGSEMPLRSSAWQEMPELVLASMSMAQLRTLARRRWVCGYAGMNRARLTARLLKRLGRRPRRPRGL